MSQCRMEFTVSIVDLQANFHTTRAGWGVKRLYALTGSAFLQRFGVQFVCVKGRFGFMGFGRAAFQRSDSGFFGAFGDLTFVGISERVEGLLTTFWALFSGSGIGA